MGLKRSMLVYVSFMLITISNCQFLINKDISWLVEYLGLALILIDIYFNKTLYRKNIIILQFLFVLAIFCIGIILQEKLPVVKKISLVLSMFILATIAMFPSKAMEDRHCLDYISKGIITGLFLSTILSGVSGLPLVTPASEGIFFNYGFNGGFQHRNYYAYVLLSVFFVRYFIYKCKRTKYNCSSVMISLFLMILSNSRSSYIILLLFLFVFNYKKMCKKIHKKTHKKIHKIIKLFENRRFTSYGGIVSLLFLLGIPIYCLFTMKSETLSFRVNGLRNYFNTFGTDLFHMIFGNAEMAFRNTGMQYDHNIRSITGWNGSTELVVLNIIVKNGLIGFVGYLVIFKRYLKVLEKLKSERVCNFCFAVLTCILCSAFVESFLANINFTYTVFSYLILGGMINLDQVISRNGDSI